MDFFLFFFSSRRRHTRFSRYWSSDVCSSDLQTPKLQYRICLFPEALQQKKGGFFGILPYLLCSQEVRENFPRNLLICRTSLCSPTPHRAPSARSDSPQHLTW